MRFSFQQRNLHTHTRSTIPLDKFIDMVVEKDLYGLVECNIHVPDHLKSYYSQFPPIFKNVDVSINDVGPYTEKLCKEQGVLKQPKRTLISSYFGNGQLLTTDQIKWYVEHGKCFVLS